MLYWLSLASMHSHAERGNEENETLTFRESYKNSKYSVSEKNQ